MRHRHVRAIIAALSLALVAAGDPPKVGDIAPDFEMVLVDGTKVRLADLRGQVVVINFWATWCVPCRRELPLLDRFYELRKDAGLRVFAITTEGSIPVHRLRKLFAAMDMPAARRISGSYGNIAAVPTNYVIDRAGRVRYAKAAAFDLDAINATLIPLLREPAP